MDRYDVYIVVGVAIAIIGIWSGWVISPSPNASTVGGILGYLGGAMMVHGSLRGWS